eukprot:8340809-Pyramimonas_sp.AAC.1
MDLCDSSSTPVRLEVGSRSTRVLLRVDPNRRTFDAVLTHGGSECRQEGPQDEHPTPVRRARGE